jgi:hypothetical protein
MSIGGLVPLPSDALVTPVTFRVKKRILRGFLAPFDKVETGTRELSGEWVVGKKTWQRLQAEWKATRSQRHLSPDQILKPGLKTKEQVILYVHGGMRAPYFYFIIFSDISKPQVPIIFRAPLPRGLFQFPCPSILMLESSVSQIMP